MAVFDLLAVINLKSSYKKAANWLAAYDYDCIFLPLPVAVERYIKRGLNIGVLSNQSILREPEDAQLIKAMQPLFEYLSKMERTLEIHCYKADPDWSFSHDFTIQILLLTLRSKLQGIKVEEWMRLLMDEAVFAEEAICREAYLLSTLAKSSGKNACITSYGSEELKSLLERMGHEVELIELDVSATPLDKLRAEIKMKRRCGGEVSRGLAEKLISMHLKFTDLVLEKGYEEAYEVWLEVSKELESSSNNFHG